MIVTIYTSSPTVANITFTGGTTGAPSGSGSFDAPTPAQRAARIALLSTGANGSGTSLYSTQGGTAAWTYSGTSTLLTSQPTTLAAGNPPSFASVGPFAGGQNKIIIATALNNAPGHTISGTIFGFTMPAGFTWGAIGATGTVAYGQNNAGNSLTNTGTWIIASAGAPEIVVSGNGNTIFDGDLTPLLTDFTDFGTTTLGSPIQRVFRVDNTGTAALTTSGLTLPTGFSLVEGLSASIGVGLFDTFTVQLDALAAGTYSGQISFTNNDADENPFNFTITGSVVAPEPSTFALAALGLTGLGLLAWRRRR